jgi:gamma-glutamyltranspeptidase / glutathione hydrolase
MKTLFHRCFFVFILCPFALSYGQPTAGISSVNSTATEAGDSALVSFGNAIDAAITTALTLGIVDAHNSGIGGGCFILIRAADGTLTCIDGREMAPAAARRDMFVREGRLDEEASKTGALASGVPGALAAYDLAMRKHGKLGMAAALETAAEVADKGFPIDEIWARKLAGVTDKVLQFPASVELLLNPDGSPKAKGDLQKNPDLAALYRRIAKNGIQEFYTGSFAKACVAWMAAEGGIMTLADFANYKVMERVPLRSHYRGYELIGMPPPSSGGIHVAQVLAMVESHPIGQMAELDRRHLFAEAMKLAFADRAHWLGDPDYAKVPRGLLAPSYLKQQSAKIRMDAASPVPGHGTPDAPHDDVFGKHTTHLCTMDAQGNWVSITQTINTSFGSKVVIPGTGVVMNNEMDDFSIQPGVPNAFKLIGAEANAVAPGKRPLSSMSPTIVLKDGKPIGCVGAAGGPTIITQVIQALSNVIDLGMTPEEALAVPRIHHQWMPDELRIEKSAAPELIQGLKDRGHTVSSTDRMGATQMIWLTAGGKPQSAHDPRVPGKAIVR